MTRKPELTAQMSKPSQGDQTKKQGPLSSLAKESTWLDIPQELAHRPWLDFCVGEGQEYEHEGTPNMVPTPKHLNLHKHSRFLSQEQEHPTHS